MKLKPQETTFTQLNPPLTGKMKTGKQQKLSSSQPQKLGGVG